MQLNYRKLGQGKPLFILHGLFGLSDNWATVGKMLSSPTPTLPTREGVNTAFEVYLIDLRNHGSSPHSDEWNYSAMAEDIKELAVDLFPHSPTPLFTLLGHSLGGKVAMQFASMFPKMLEKLIVVDMAPKDYPGSQFDFIEKLLEIDLLGVKSRKEAEAELKKIIRDNATIQLLLKNIQWQTSSPALLPGEKGVEQPASPPTPLLGERGAQQPEILSWKFNLKVIAKNQDKIGKTFSIKDRIETPALFIRGERSNYILDSDIPNIKKIFPNSEVKTIAGAGHWVHADKPEEFGKVIREFI